jgi:hypothetical protein
MTLACHSPIFRAPEESNTCRGASAFANSAFTPKHRKPTTIRSEYCQIVCEDLLPNLLYIHIDQQVSHDVGRQQSGRSLVLPGHLKDLGTHGTHVSYDAAKYTSPLRVDGLISGHVTRFLKTVCTLFARRLSVACSESDEAALVRQYLQGYLGI